MTKLKIACVQMRSSRDMAENIETASRLIEQAAAEGATLISTPEMTTLLERSAKSLFEIATDFANDPSIPVFKALAKRLKVWLHIGSVPVLTDGGKCANRALFISPDGELLAHYDKIHMFDVELGGGEAYRESRSYKPGDRAVMVKTPFGGVGLSICYDLRFAHLYRTLAKAGADILMIPAAFTKVTGQAHWHVLLRARAIETGCFVVAAAQGGLHADGRETFGHSLIIAPWGEVLAEAEHAKPGIICAEIDLEEVARARGRVPALTHDREITLDVIDAL
ncbi:carbon-nitrogen hydrolase family protein [Ponticaulis profundi]|uniref:Carbon-nitrogen hydrolase family protein n=1 Tax=Ponticaulis profundi TaxID=2665222 RepID=A0ABW1SC38_9PROT